MDSTALAHPIVVVSPHLDDAVLSCANILEAYAATTVVTVFAGAPPVTHRGYNSRVTGRRFAPEAIGVRREEDARALGAVGAHPVWLDLLEQDYATHRGEGDYSTVVAEALRGSLERLHPETVVLPLGLWHPDHLLVSEAGLAVAGERDAATVLYMDLPYGIALPGAVQDRLTSLATSWSLKEIDAGASHPDKRALMREYASQVRPTRRSSRRAFAATMRGGERYWRVTAL